MKGKSREVRMELKEQVERIKEILPNRTEGEIYEALKDCKMDFNDAAERLLSQEEHRETAPTDGKDKVERIKKMVPRFAEQLICEVLKQCNMDSNLAIQRLLSQEKGKNRENAPTEWKEQFKCMKEMVPQLIEEDQDGVPMEWKEQFERIKEMMPHFTKEMIYKMLEQCYIDSGLALPRLPSLSFDFQPDGGAFRTLVRRFRIDLEASEMPSNSGSLSNNFSSPPSNAKSSVTCQLHSVSLDKGKEVFRCMEDKAATASRNNVRALRAKGSWSSHAVQAGSDPMAIGNNVASSFINDLGDNEALGSSEFLEYKLFPPPTQQFGISLMLNDLVANTDQPSELRCLLRLPFLDTSAVPSRSSAAGSQHPQTSISESGPSEGTPSNSPKSGTPPFRDPQDPVLNAPFARSKYGPTQCPRRMSENAQPFTSSASIHQSPETLILGNNMSTGRGFTHPYIKLRSYDPQCPLQHSNMDGCDNMHRNFGNDMSSTQQEVHHGGSSSQASANAYGWGSFLGEGRAPHQFLTNSPAPSDISRLCNDSALHCQSQHQQINDHFPAGMQKYNNAAWNHQPDSEAMSALPKLQRGGFPGWALLPAKANNQRGEGSSLQYAYRGYPTPETSIMPNHQQ